GEPVIGGGVGNLVGTNGTARVSNQDVAAGHGGGQRLHLGPVGDVELVDLGTAARGGDPGRHRLELVDSTGGQNHVVALAGEPFGRRRSDTAACPGNNRCPLHASNSASNIGDGRIGLFTPGFPWPERAHLRSDSWPKPFSESAPSSSTGAGSLPIPSSTPLPHGWKRTGSTGTVTPLRC